MKIGIVNFFPHMLDFSVNLAKYLEKRGHTVYFLNPDRFVSRQLRKFNCKIIYYPPPTKIIKYYKPDSNIITFYKMIYSIKNINKLISQFNKEYSAALEFLKSSHFDVLIMNRGLRVERDVSKELGINTLFCENGYLPGTLQMDHKGVNADVSFANLSLAEFLKFYYPTSNRDFMDYNYQKVNYNFIKYVIDRIFDPRYNWYLHKILLVKIKRELASIRFRLAKQDKLDIDKLGKFIFFPLQVNTDTQIIHYCKYKNIYDVLDNVLPPLKKTGYKIILKEHPAEVEPVNYKRYVDNKQVFLVKKYDLNKLIDKSEFVVVINSSVGLQAIARYKRVLLLGDSFYKNAPSCLIYDNIKNKDNLINEIQNIKVNKEAVNKYIKHFREVIFIDGHWRNANTELLNKIAKRLEGIANKSNKPY